MLATTASISLLVGGIGIMNIMLVSVTERTRNWPAQSDWRRAPMALTIEAVILSTVGGLFGILLGVGAHWWWLLTPLQAVISPVAIVVAVVVSGAIGLAGVVPARSAAA